MAESWMPREEWDALVRGEGCPLCAEVKGTETQQGGGYRVATLRMGVLRLAANQYAPGYSVFLCKRHVREPYELPPAEYTLYFDDLMRVGRALEQVYRPAKMNFQILGNAVPHLHCHLVPRYYGDAAPGRPLDPNRELRPLESPAAYLAQAEKIRNALGNVLE
jgi:diadenosine tetraphosphate (Ap4A) HIT family hydrolase